MEPIHCSVSSLLDYLDLGTINSGIFLYVLQDEVHL